MSKVQVDKVVNLSDDGAPQLTYGAELPVGYGLTGAGGLNISGVVTAASAVFSGNVTIGGTLTYEDVTNIDVVGVSTFAGRMNVNSTINANEGIKVIGVSTLAAVTGTTGTFSGDVSIADKIVHTGDTDTAIRFSDANTITAETAGDERFKIDSTGRIFAKTDESTTGLVIQNSVHDSQLRIEASAANKNSVIHFADGDDGDVGIIDYDHNNNSLAFTVNASEVVRIASDGDMGVGTASPSTRLHVNGGDGLLVERSSGTSVAGFKQTGGSAMNIYFQNSGSTNHPSLGSSNQDLTFGTNNTESARITSDGELLVALTSGSGSATDARLQVRGDSHAKSKIQVLGTHNDDNPASLVIAKSRGSGNVILGDNDDIGQLDFAGNDGNGYHIIGRIAVSSSGEGNGDDDLPTVMRFFTTGNGTVTNTERMRIASDGALLVKTTSNTNAHTQADDLVVGNTSHGHDTGVTIVSNTSYNGWLCFF